MSILGVTLIPKACSANATMMGHLWLITGSHPNAQPPDTSSQTLFAENCLAERNYSLSESCELYEW